jgi:hypothetical protein
MLLTQDSAFLYSLIRKRNKPAKALQRSFFRSLFKDISIFLILTLWPVNAMADFVGPLVTDPADPIEIRKFALEMTPTLLIKQGNYDENGSVRYFPGGDREYHFTTFIKTYYGIFENAELSVLIPVSYYWTTRSEGSDQDGGLGDILLGAKYRFLENDKNGLRPSISAVAKVKFPTGKYENLSKEKLETDLTGNGSYEYVLGLNVSKSFGNWELHANFWYDWVAETTIDGVKTRPGNIVYYNLAVEYALTQKLNALLELNGWHQGLTAKDGQEENNSDGRSLSLLPGLEYRLNESLYMIFGISIPLLGKNTDYGITPAFLINYTF